MALLRTLTCCACFCALTVAQQLQHTTPVPILKQINRQNDDGSYSFGYEAADGSYKIETKYPTGDVAGKYGYVDDSGNLREVEYGASSKRGFEPTGSGINVPPPTLHDPSNSLSPGDEDDGQYREDPSIYEDPKYNSVRPQKVASRYPASQPSAIFKSVQQPVQQYQQPTPQYQQPAAQYQQHQQYQQPAPLQFPQQQHYQQPQQYQQPAAQQFPQPSFSSSQQYQPHLQSQVYHTQPQFSYQQYQPSQYQQNASPQYPLLNNHPAQNLDLNTGSYSIQFTG